MYFPYDILSQKQFLLPNNYLNNRYNIFIFYIQDPHSPFVNHAFLLTDSIVSQVKSIYNPVSHAIYAYHI